MINNAVRLQHRICFFVACFEIISALSNFLFIEPRSSISEHPWEENG